MHQMSMKVNDVAHACATLTDCQFTTADASTPTLTGNAQLTSRRFLSTVTQTTGNFDLDVTGTAFGTVTGEATVFLTDTTAMHTAKLTYTGTTTAVIDTKVTARFTGVTSGTY
jgi:hypothetical protein